MVDWESQYLNEETPWDKGKAAPPLVEFLESNTVCGKIVVPGCGRGHDVRLLAEQNDAQILGLDISPRAISLANAFPKSASETYLAGDLFDLPSELRGTFDWGFEHTCFCAIPVDRRQDYVESMASLLKPGGKLLAIFYVIVDDPTPDHPPYPVTPNEIDNLFAPQFETLDTWIPERAYPSRQGGKEQMRILQKSI